MKSVFQEDQGMKPRMWNIFIIFSLFSILLIPPQANTQAYKWVDEEGNIHFTDDFGKIPEKFRKKQIKEYRFEKPTSKEESEDQVKREEKQKEKVLEKEKSIRQPILEEKQCGKCRIVSYSQVKKGTGVGVQRGLTFIEFAETCAQIIIKNDSCKKRYINQDEVVADVIIRDSNLLVGKVKKSITPKDKFSIGLEPGETYQGSVCFGVLVDTIEDMYLD